MGEAGTPENDVLDTGANFTLHSMECGVVWDRRNLDTNSTIRASRTEVRMGDGRL